MADLVTILVVLYGFTCWVLGCWIARGAGSTIAAVIVPPWAWLLIADMIVSHFRSAGGWLNQFRYDHI